MPAQPDLIIVTAVIRFRTTAEGGRMTPVKSGYRPNHVFERKPDGLPLQTYIGDVQFENPDYMQLGETRTVTVRFLRNPVVERYVQVGRKWWLNEAARIVGDGEIIEIAES